ncbi:MAG: HD domain-containing protein [Candidatus Shapirobacteria bacterium]
MSTFDNEKVKLALKFATLKHEGQLRESGEEYVTHPIWVAKTVDQLEVGEEAVIAAILHDCVEDTDTTIDEIAEIFGDEVALLVSGLTDVKNKTSGIEIHNTNVDVFRKFLFSSVNDVRVLIIRLADKLHNGITIGSLSKDRQIKYAKRVFGIYGPVAEYVGLHYFKRQLEDIAFNIMYPKDAKKLTLELKKAENEDQRILYNITNDINLLLKANRIDGCEVSSRVKGLYSSYLKVKAKGMSNLKDGVGIRIICKDVSDCYTILGLLHARFEYIPECFDDYISSPKISGYRSIQTTVKLENDKTAEIQIRTFEMHEFNEFGPASHIAYKMSKNLQDGRGYEWVKELVSWQRNDDKVNNYKISVLSKYIYVFTPKGDTIQLLAGSTPIDFAYRVHSSVGNRCRGVKINKKMAKISDELKTGDLVEILTTKNNNVNKDWLRIAQTSAAKEMIRKAIGQFS